MTCFLSAVSELTTPGESVSIGGVCGGDDPPPLALSAPGDSMATTGVDVNCRETGQSTRE